MEWESNSEYMYDAPYPTIQVLAPSHEYAELLLEDYGGKEGKFTDLQQYRYHSYVLREENPEVAYHLAQIAKVEEYHLALLADAILQLGGYPAYRSGDGSNNITWTADHVTYGRRMKEQLNYDLEQEYRSIRNYNTHIAIIRDSSIKQLLRRLVRDEEVHVRWLERMLRENT